MTRSSAATRNRFSAETDLESDKEIKRDDRTDANGTADVAGRIHSGTVYLAGQVAADPSAGVAGQTQQILRTIDELLAQAGSDKTRILSATVYLSDVSTFAEMNSAWDNWVPAGHTPARATVEARLAA